MKTSTALSTTTTVDLAAQLRRDRDAIVAWARRRNDLIHGEHLKNSAYGMQWCGEELVACQVSKYDFLADRDKIEPHLGWVDPRTGQVPSSRIYIGRLKVPALTYEGDSPLRGAGRRSGELVPEDAVKLRSLKGEKLQASFGAGELQLLNAGHAAFRRHLPAGVLLWPGSR